MGGGGLTGCRCMSDFAVVIVALFYFHVPTPTQRAIPTGSINE